MTDEGCGTVSGLVQFMISWQGQTDVDLEVTDPTGSPARVGAVSTGGLVKDHDCPGRDDRRCRGVNLENVVLVQNHELTPGLYSVVVRLAPKQEPKEPVSVNLTARLGSTLVNTQLSLSRSRAQRAFQWRL